MRIHLTGICGTAMAALAGMLKDSGHEVVGSDANPYPPMSTHLERLGIPIMRGYRGENLAGRPELVVVGNVCSADHPEVIAAGELGLPMISLPQALRRFFLEGRTPVVLAGTHGKTTLTSLTAWILLDAGLDPSCLVGGIPVNIGSNYRLGRGDHFVIEGDEYDTAFFDKGPKFMHYAPFHAALTSVECDHADIYRDLDHVREAFTKFVRLIPEEGSLVVCSAFPDALEVAVEAACPVRVYGTVGDEDWTATHLRSGNGRTRFRVSRRLANGRLRTVTEVDLPMTGEHNVQNALAALLLARDCGVSFGDGARALARFKGVAKRQQVLGDFAGVPVIDDFAHHPTAVERTLEGLRAGYEPERLVAAYHFESNTSRRRLFEDRYVQALARADVVYLSRPLRKNDSLTEYLDADKVAARLTAAGCPAVVIDDIDEMADAIAAELRPGDLFVGMSGRDFGGLHHKILARSKAASDQVRP